MIHRHALRLGAALFLCLLAVSQSSIIAQPPRDFAADQVILDNGTVMEAGKIYVSGLKSRTEGIVGLTIIVRRDRQLSWTLNPKSKTYTEKAMTAEELKMALGDIPGEVSRTRIGSERILGYNCVKYQVTFKSMRGTDTAFLWQAESLGIPIRTEVPNFAISELRNIRVGAQPLELFEVPAGYRKSEGLGAGGGAVVPEAIAEMLSGGRRGTAGTVNPPTGASGGTAGAPRPPAAMTGGTASAAQGQRQAPTSYQMEFKTDRPGGDYRDFELPNADPKACAAACARDVDCRAWTYGKPGAGGEKAHCWLKNEVPDPVANDEFISGVKGGNAEGLELNTNRAGFDFRDMELPKADPKACQAACDRDAKCVAWTYVKAGIQGERAHCWLKDQIPEPSEDESCISGIKRIKFEP
jgi:hypothetical protein